MDDYLNSDMVEAINACKLTSEANNAVRQILMRERNQKNMLMADDVETIEQYDRIINEAIASGGSKYGTF